MASARRWAWAWAWASLAAAHAAQAQEVRFFDDDEVTFKPSKVNDRTRVPEDSVEAPSAPAPTGAAGDEEATEADPSAMAEQVEDPVPPETPIEDTPPAPPSVKPPERLRTRAPLRVSTADEVQVLGIRELTELERQRMKESLRCSDPLAAEVVVTGRLRTLLALLAELPAEKMPEQLSWVFSPSTRCFERAQNAQEFERLDEAARRAVARKGK